EDRTKDQQVFSIAGSAGTGKSTIIKHLVDELGLDDGEVLFGTYTGKAAHVLRKNGTPCRTIHSLIYRAHEANEAEIAASRRRLDELQTAALDLTGAERAAADVEIATLRRKITEMRKPRFGFNEQSEVRDCRLLILDEVSMVGPEMESDILSFGKPVLVLGD